MVRYWFIVNFTPYRETTFPTRADCFPLFFNFGETIMSRSVLSTYFRNALVKAGFPEELKVEYSLSYCQGDGIAFYGTLDYEDLISLYNKIYPPKIKQKMFAKLISHIWEWEHSSNIRFEIQRNGFGHHYSHWNTMELYALQADELEFFNNDAARKEWYFPKAKLGNYKALWDDFIVRLEQYIKDTSKELEQQGYKIIEATPEEKTLYQFTTKNYQVRLNVLPSDFYQEPAYWIFGDDKYLPERIKPILAGTSQICHLRAEVIDDQGEMLGYARKDDLQFDINDQDYLLQWRRELVTEAISSARYYANKHHRLHA